jgi:hypothetical protein
MVVAYYNQVSSHVSKVDQILYEAYKGLWSHFCPPYEAVTTPTILGLPDFSQTFTIECNACVT